MMDIQSVPQFILVRRSLNTVQLHPLQFAKIRAKKKIGLCQFQSFFKSFQNMYKIYL